MATPRSAAMAMGKPGMRVQAANVIKAKRILSSCREEGETAQKNNRAHQGPVWYCSALQDR